MAAAWDHGYYSNSPYTSGFYRELAPNWLDFAALLKGHTPPRAHEGVPFRYLELGSGTGLGLCLLAAAYPEGSFLGVDFHPDHISQSMGLIERLGLGNVTVLEADFLELQRDPSPLGLRPGAAGPFDYVAAHGIVTWVGAAVQEALLAVAAAALRPGGIFYCSYNTYPGWLARTTFQKLFWLESERGDPAQPGASFGAALASMGTLLGEAEAPGLLGHALPGLRAELDWIAKENPDYLCGEYANEGWAPLYVADFHRRCAEHKFSHLGSATLPEQFDELLAPSFHALILQETNPLMRQTLLDLATNKAFRRDLFVKGRSPLTRLEADRWLAALSLQALERRRDPAPGSDQAVENPYVFATSFGQVVGDPAVYALVEEVLASGPQTLQTLQQRSAQPVGDLLLIITLLLNDGRIALDRGKAARKAAPGAQRVNRQLGEALALGKSCGYLVLPQVGTCTEHSLVEHLLHQASAQGLEGAMLASCVLMELSSLGVNLLGPDRQPILGPDDQLARLQELSERFSQGRLPMLRRLGALPR
ncbi:methyltransferase regulatory domain-containing protein [Cyanobium sp. Morenito 9A2]|uniref:class I SAM-dependent methyltransferase n=1 Tax=Cyanobium sp. Morenito 9A2 TaxID=2823718 RepID=UPI0020CC74E6|nr:methyltransferase regulatory domain-containing protein [Cyanobium sp. Morenito 9A2]MCP9848797.1 methyltransferase regulatory domain-containing protein [Cyanobium sp. Morenito 9A2]